MKGRTPRRAGFEEIIKKSFRYWYRNLGYQAIFTLLYFSVIFIPSFYFYNRLGLHAQFTSLFAALGSPEKFQQAVLQLSSAPEFQNFTLLTVLFKALLFPLNIGLLYIYRKNDLHQPASLSDIFEGFRGLQFFKFASYAVFWGMVFMLSKVFLPLSVLWVVFTLFVSPVMFFTNRNASESISVSAAVLKTFWPVILGCSLFAALFSYCGLLLGGVGILFTFPFWNAVIYAMYSTFFREK